jgi:transposase
MTDLEQISERHLVAESEVTHVSWTVPEQAQWPKEVCVMERKERRHHTREFKLEAVRLAAVGDKTKAKVARELGVRVNQLRQWRLDFEEEERNGVPKQQLATAEQDLGALRRENARLREENELLKKAAIYFAKASR